MQRDRFDVSTFCEERVSARVLLEHKSERVERLVCVAGATCTKRVLDAPYLAAVLAAQWRDRTADIGLVTARIRSTS